MITNKRIRVLHITKWFPNEADPQQGIFIQRHIESIADSVENHVLFVYESTVQEEWVKSFRSQQPFGMLHRVKLRTGMWAVQKKLTKIALFHHYITEVVQPDLIHFHIATPDQAIAGWLARRKRIPFVVAEHWGGYLDNRFASFSFFQRRMVGYLLQKAAFVLPVSRVLWQGMLSNGLKYNAVILPNIVKVPATASKKYPDFTFIVIADMDDAIKRIRGVISAFAQLQKEFPQIQLEVIGGGPDFERVKNYMDNLQVAANVKLHGRKAQEEAMEVLAASHCLLINSVRETFSVVGVEALSLGIPVISSKCGGPEEYLKPTYSIVFENQEALLDAMRKMVNEVATFSKAAKSFNALPYQSDVVGEKIAQMYAHALRSK